MPPAGQSVRGGPVGSSLVQLVEEEVGPERDEEVVAQQAPGQERWGQERLRHQRADEEGVEALQAAGAPGGGHDQAHQHHRRRAGKEKRSVGRVDAADDEINEGVAGKPGEGRQGEAGGVEGGGAAPEVARPPEVGPHLRHHRLAEAAQVGPPDAPVGHRHQQAGAHQGGVGVEGRPEQKAPEVGQQAPPPDRAGGAGQQVDGKGGQDQQRDGDQEPELVQQDAEEQEGGRRPDREVLVAGHVEGGHRAPADDRGGDAGEEVPGQLAAGAAPEGEAALGDLAEAPAPKADAGEGDGDGRGQQFRAEVLEEAAEGAGVEGEGPDRGQHQGAQQEGHHNVAGGAGGAGPRRVLRGVVIRRGRGRNGRRRGHREQNTREGPHRSGRRVGRGAPPKCRHVLPVLRGKVWATRKAKIKPIRVGSAGADRAVGPPHRLRWDRGTPFNGGRDGGQPIQEEVLIQRAEAGAGPLTSALPTPRAMSRRRSYPSDRVRGGGDDARRGEPREDRGLPADASGFALTGRSGGLAARQEPSTAEKPLGAPANGAQGRCSWVSAVPEEGLEPSRCVSTNGF